MDRWRAAGALLALAACFACTAAAPTASNHTALDLYEGAPEGCYYNFQHYGEGDRIMTNEPCLNCTCHNRMLMCYLRVCPFTKAIGQDCTVEKRADQCCPIVTCPDVPVDLLTSTSTTSPAEYGATGLGKLDKYGCSINGKYFPEGSKVPPTPNKPCEHCYCIRNMTTCVMQECTLHVDGCTPIYHKDVCCPVRYSCDHPEDEVPLLDDMSTTVRPTPGFLLTTTTMAPVTQMTQDCVHDDQIFSDGASIKTEKACEHCYCMKGDIVCVVQECGAPMENEGKNCTSLPPREGQCCPDTYICEGDELNTDVPTDYTTETFMEKLTTIVPPRRGGVEGSGYRNEPDEGLITEMPTVEPEVEGSGEEQDTSKPGEDVVPGEEDKEQYIPITTQAPPSEQTDVKVQETTDEHHVYASTTDSSLKEEITTSGIKDYTHTTIASESPEGMTTEHSKVPTIIPDLDTRRETAGPYEPTSAETATSAAEDKITPIANEYTTPKTGIVNELETATSADVSFTPEPTEKEYFETDSDTTTSRIPDVAKPGEDDKEISGPQIVPSTDMPLEYNDKLTTEPDHALNTVAVAEEDTHYPHVQTTTIGLSIEDEERTTDKIDMLVPHDHKTTSSFDSEENEFTTVEPDKGLNTIPSENNEETSSEPSPLDKTSPAIETKATESSAMTEGMQNEDFDTKQTTVSESATLQPESIVTKGDQYTITTEPSFRKEDEAGVSTDKPKDYELTTIKSEFVDEGLIPTSEHDHKYETSSNVPSTDEDLTTSIPEYTKEIEDSYDRKQTTTEPIMETSAITDSFSSKIPQREGEYSTEKIAEGTTVIPEEPGRIPGEGDCLLNGITYSNNSVVPSTNNCHTGCRCASSIIKCDPIICSPPPDYMTNCRTIDDSPDACCPTYVCDHPKETVPPQSDNQMSGTESPVPTPTIECRGDQCELSEPTKQPTKPTEMCASDDCTAQETSKPETECGPEGCGYILPKPDIPLLDHKPECGPEGCEHVSHIPVQTHEQPEDCANGKCQLPPTEGQVSAVKPCDGEHCEKEGDVVFQPPLSCENEADCKAIATPDIQATPCEGESCKKIDCGGNGCDSNVISTPHVTEQVSCEGEDCKLEDTSLPECTGDEPCRRKESSSTECKDSDCFSGTEETPSKDLIDNEIPAEGEKTTEQPDVLITKPVEITPEKDTTTMDTSEGTSKPDVGVEVVTDKPTIGEEEKTDKPLSTVDHDKETEKPATQDDTAIKPAVDEEEEPVSPDVVEKEKPDITKEETESPAISDDKETKPIVDEEKDTEKPTITAEVEKEKPVISEERTDKPATDEDIEMKPTVDEKGDTDKPAGTDEIEKEKPVVTEELTEKPVATDENEIKPVLDEEKEIEKPALTDEEKPNVDEESTKKPYVDEDDKSTVIDEDVTEDIATVDMKGTEKPILIDQDDKNIATVIQHEGTEPGVTEEGTEKPVVTSEEDKNKPIVDKEKPFETPVTKDKEVEEKPYPPEDIPIEKEGITEKVGEEEVVTPATKEESTEKPDVHKETGSDKEITTEEDITTKPAIIEGDIVGTTPAIEEDQTVKPSVVEPTKKPGMTEDDSGKAPEEESTQIPIAVEDVSKDKHVGEEEPTQSSVIPDEQSTEKSVMEEDKEKPIVDEEPITESPITTEEKPAEEPTETEDKQKVKPDVTYEQNTDKPALEKDEEQKQPSTDQQPEEIDTKEPVTPTLVEKEISEGTKTPVYEREGTEQPEIKETEEPTLTDELDKHKPTEVDKESTDKPTVFEQGTETPIITTDIEKKPAFEEGTTEKLDTVKEEDISKPGLEDDKQTPKPDSVGDEDKIGMVDEGSTDMTPVIEEENTEKSSVTDNKEVVTPTSYEEKDSTTPVSIDEGSKTKPQKEEDSKRPSFVEEIDTEKPVEDTSVIIDEDFTVKPTEEGSGSEIPDVHVPETEKLSTLPDILKPTDPSEHQEPIYESQTTPNEEIPVHSTEPGTADRSSTPQPFTASESPEKQITKSEDDESYVPVITEHSHGPEISTVPQTQEELTTKSPIFISEGDEKDVATETSIDHTSPAKEEGKPSTDGVTLGMKIPETTESAETITKSIETGEFDHPEPVTKGESLVTKAPDTELPTKDTDKPELPSSEQDSTTKVYDEHKKVPDVTDETVSYESTSAVPGQTDSTDHVTSASDTETEDKEKAEIPTHDLETEKMSTEHPVDVSEEDKTVPPELHTPDKDKLTTEAPAYSTIEPVRSFTEIEDSAVTGQQEIVTGYTEAHTEEILEKVTTSEKPMLETSDTTVPAEGDKAQATEIPNIEKEVTEPAMAYTTGMPISEVTESQAMTENPEKDTISHEEKVTRVPDLTYLEEHTDKPESYTDTPQYHVTPSDDDHSKAPESYTTELHINEVQETSTKSGESELPESQPITTEISQTSSKEEAETKSPDELHTEHNELSTQEPFVTESLKLSSEMPISSEDMQTETPYKQVTSESPQSLVTGHHEDAQTTESSVMKEETKEPEPTRKDIHDSTEPVSGSEMHTESPHQVTESVEHITEVTQPELTEQEDKVTKVPVPVTEKQDELHTVMLEEVTDKYDIDERLPEITTDKHTEEVVKSTEHPAIEYSETTPYLIELEEHTHKIIQDMSTISPSEEERTDKPVEDVPTSSPSVDEHLSTVPPQDERSTLQPDILREPPVSELTTKKLLDEDIETSTRQSEVESEKVTESAVSIEKTTSATIQDVDHKEEYPTSAPEKPTEKAPITESSDTEKPLYSTESHETPVPEDDSTTKSTTVRHDEDASDDKFVKPDEKPSVTSEIPPPSTTAEIPKPSIQDMQPTDEISTPDEDGHFPPSGTTGYGEPDYVEEDQDQAFGPGTCRYGGKVYVSAQQIPRDDPCDFCFCFRSDIICLQQSCPPPIHGCHEEPIQGFCCPRYECPVSMATTVNVTTTTTTTTTTLPPHFPTHSYKGAAQRRGCQIKGHTYKVGEVVRSSSGPCLHCTCGGDGQMKCDPKACTPEPMLRQMIAAAVSAKRRR